MTRTTMMTPRGGPRTGWRAGGLAALMTVALLLPVLLVPATPARATITNEALMDSLQHTAFLFFWNEANAANGLIKDRSTGGSPASIASVGFGLTAICIGIDHGWISRADGRQRVLTTLQTFWNGPQGTGTSNVMGYKGFYYHFLTMASGFREWSCELSSIDTALLLAGVIDVKQYFNTADPVDGQVRALSDSIYYRVDWEFMRNGGNGLKMGWKPETGFSGFGNWVGYNEAMIMYILGLGSPTHPLPNGTPNVWSTWTSGYVWLNNYYGQSFVYFPPLFGHQYSHCWIDFRTVQDSYMLAKGITYFENSRRATLAQRAYCISNPYHWSGYGADMWGLTACDGYNGYKARGAPPAQNDDGTIAPTAAAGSIPFTPDESLAVLQNMYNSWWTPLLWGPYGFRDAFNLHVAWFDTDYIGIDEGPIVVMIENYRNGNVWWRFMQNPDVQRGLMRAGFVAAAGVDDRPPAGIPAFRLSQNSPNPFETTTRISYRLDQAGPVSLRLFDVVGRPIRSLYEGTQAAGEHEVVLDSGGLPAGLYFYRLEKGGATESRRCLVVH